MFPVSQPECKVFDEYVHFSEPEQLDSHKNARYFDGIMKVLLLPPRNDELQGKIPAVPARFDSRLLFPYCRKCCEMNPKGIVTEDIANVICPHHDYKQRSWVATLARPEIELALKEVI